MQTKNLKPSLQHGLNHHAFRALGVSGRVRCRLNAARQQSTTVSEAPADASVSRSEGAEGSACPVLRQLKALDEPAVGQPAAFIRTLMGEVAQLNKETLGSKPFALGYIFGLFKLLYVQDMEVAKDLVAREGSGQVSVGWPPSTVALLGENALSAVKDVGQHKRLRRLMQPAMGAEAVDSYLPKIQQLAEKMLGGMADTCARESRPVLAMPECKSFTFKVISSVAIGLDLEDAASARLEHLFNVWVKNLFTPYTINAWPFPFAESMRARETILDTIRDHVRSVKAEMDQQQATSSSSPSTSRPTSKPTTLQRMLVERDEEGRGLSEPEILDNMLTLLFAGHDTSSSLLAQLLYYLYLNPEVMQRLRDEQADVVARFGPEMSPEAVSAMRYTHAVMQEGLRIRPIIANGMRVATSEQELHGYSVPSGMSISYQYGHITRNDSRWAGKPPGDPLDPSTFNPDRFLTEAGSKQGEQVPFGMGARTCLGAALAVAEVKVFLAVLARGYTYTADANTQFVPVPIPRPKNNLPVYMKRL